MDIFFINLSPLQWWVNKWTFVLGNFW